MAMESRNLSTKAAVPYMEENSTQHATNLAKPEDAKALDVQASPSLEKFGLKMETRLKLSINSCMNIFQSLPDEVLLLIFEQFLEEIILKVPTDLCRVSLVCRRWNTIVTPILYRSMRVAQPLLDTIRKESIGSSILRLIQTHSQQLSMIIYTKHPFYPLDWVFVAEIITGCRNLRWVRCDFRQTLYRSYTRGAGGQAFTRPSARESIFPPVLLDAMQSHSKIKISVRSFSIGTSSFLPTSSLTFFHGYIADKSKGNLFISQLPLTRIGTLKLWSSNYCVEVKMPKGCRPWNWSQLHSLKLEIMNNFDSDDALLLQLQQTHFNRLNRFSYWDLTGASQLVNHASLLRSIFKDTKIRDLEIIIRDQPDDIVFQVASMGPKLKILQLNYLSAPNLQIVADACPNLRHLRLHKANLPCEGDELDFFNNFRVFPRLKKVFLHKSWTNLETMTTGHVYTQLRRLIDGISERLPKRRHMIGISRYFRDTGAGKPMAYMSVFKEESRGGTRFDERDQPCKPETEGIFSDSFSVAYRRPE